MPRTLIVIAAAAVTLAGCNRSASQNNAVSAPANNSAAADAPMPNAVVPAGEPVDAAFVTRSWGMGSCDRTMTFHADGTATNSEDADIAHWSVTGTTLTITPPGDAPHPSPVTRQGDKLIMGDGPQLMTFIPCPDAPAGHASSKATDKE